MDWSLCILCQEHSRDALRCSTLSNDAQAQVSVCEVFVDAYQAHRAAEGRALPVESQDAMTAEKLLEKQAKWHRNCRRTLQWDRLANTGSPTTCQTSHREPRPRRRSSTGQQDCCLFCEEGASGKRPLHEFQKRCLTEELRTKALRMHDWKVLHKLTLEILLPMN